MNVLNFFKNLKIYKYIKSYIYLASPNLNQKLSELNPTADQLDE